MKVTATQKCQAATKQSRAIQVSLCFPALHLVHALGIAMVENRETGSIPQGLLLQGGRRCQMIACPHWEAVLSTWLRGGPEAQMASGTCMAKSVRGRIVDAKHYPGGSPCTPPT